MPELLIRSKGKDYICLYDKRDHQLISRYSWSLHSQGYAQTTINGKTVLIHRLILGIVDNPEIEADHKFHDKLDNRRAKLRICTHAENRRNSQKVKKDLQNIKEFTEDGKYFHSQILQGDKVKNLGRYHSEITAGKVYDQEAKETFKEFAFPELSGLQTGQSTINTKLLNERFIY